jgi:hypothetical protein
MLLLLYNLELLLSRCWLRIGTSRSQNVRIAPVLAPSPFRSKSRVLMLAPPVFFGAAIGHGG